MAKIIISDRVQDQMAGADRALKEAYSGVYMSTRRSGWMAPEPVNDRSMIILPMNEDHAMIACDLGTDEVVFIEIAGVSNALARADSIAFARSSDEGAVELTEQIKDKALSVLEVRETIRSDESRERFWVVESDVEFERMLASPMEKWRVFLHPSQRKIVERKLGGATLVRGGAGTGKTVVAMHRTKFLVEDLFTSTSDRVLFTTFSSNLSADISETLDTLIASKRDRDRVLVMNLDAWVADFLRKNGYERTIIYGEGYDGEDRIGQIWDEVLRDFDLDGLSREFVRDEWREVVQDQGVSSRLEYLKASRAGRGTALTGQKKARLWPIFEAFRASMEREGLAEPEDAYRHARSIIEFSRPFPAFKAVVVDEIQDMGSEALRLIRAIVPESSEDALFMVGDAHQRIYARAGSLSECGINVRGARSVRLKLNYRTSEEILRFAVGVLSGMSIPDMDGGLDTLEGYRSLFSGVDPIIVSEPDHASEARGVATWLRSLQGEGVPLAKMAVLTRTNRTANDLSRHLDSMGLPNHRLSNGRPDDPSIEGVRISTLHRAKGLEFDAVAIVNCPEVIELPKWLEGQHPDARSRQKAVQRERSLYHVGMTRARRWLHVSSSPSL